MCKRALIVGAFAIGYRSFKLQEYSRFHEDIIFPQAFDVWYIGDTVCDVLIAGTMLWILRISRKDSIGNGRDILARLVRLIVETNTLTASMALISFVCYVALPNNNIFICTTLVMGKLYSNTLLMTFNNRIAMRSIQKHHSAYDGTTSLRIRQQTDVSITVDTVHAFDAFPGEAGHIEAYQVNRLDERKTPALTVDAIAV